MCVFHVVADNFHANVNRIPDSEITVEQLFFDDFVWNVTP